MKRVISSLLLVLVLIIVPVSVAYAQVSFLLGVAAGAVLFGDGDEYGSGGANVIYTLPRASERVNNPLGIKFGNSGFRRFNPPLNRSRETSSGATIYSLFKKVESSPEDYEILQVVRVISPSDSEVAVFWFAYIEKYKVLPLDALKKK